MIFTVDFDNTCAFEDFPNVGNSVPFATVGLKMLLEFGHKIILWTCRSGKQLDDAVNWFKQNEIELYGVNDNPFPDEYMAKTYGIPRKVIGRYNIDDRNLGCPTRDFYDADTNKTYTCVDWVELMGIIKKIPNDKV